jgi:hypothetical protein
VAYTTTELLASIKRRANIPSASGVFGDAELLAMSTEELRTYIVPLVLKHREDYWLASDVQTLTAATSYPLPARAIGGKLAELSVLDSSGAHEFNLTKVSPSDLEGARPGFYMDGQGVRLFLPNGQPPTILGTTLRMRYYARPGTLILTSAAANVASIAGWPVITLSGGYASLTTPGTYDLISALSPFGLKTIFTGGYTGASMTVTTGAVDRFSVGDWVSNTDTSPVVQAPVEFHDVLAQKVAVKVLEAKGMTEKLNSARQELGRMEADASNLITPRVDGESQRAVSRGGLFRLRW